MRNFKRVQLFLLMALLSFLVACARSDESSDDALGSLGADGAGELIINDQVCHVDVLLHTVETTSETHSEILVGWAQSENQYFTFQFTCPSETRRIESSDVSYKAILLSDTGAACRFSLLSESSQKPDIYEGFLNSPLVKEVPNISRYAPGRRERLLRRLESLPVPRFASRVEVSGVFREVGLGEARDVDVMLRSDLGGISWVFWNTPEWSTTCSDDEWPGGDDDLTRALWDKYADGLAYRAWLLEHFSQDPLHSYGCVFEVASDGGRTLYFHDDAFYATQQCFWTVHVSKMALERQSEVEVEMKRRCTRERDLPKCGRVRIAVAERGAFLTIRHFACVEDCAMDGAQEAAFAGIRCALPLDVQTHGFGPN